MIEEIKRWTNQKLPKYLCSELEKVKLTDKELLDAFYRFLPFGTAGMRGKIGVGINRMNIYTVRLATYGLAKYILESDTKECPSVVIAYDTRHFSKEFAEEAAKVLGYFNIKSYLFKEPRPTPELSFAVRYLSASAGIMITASHNPKEYNGFKVYSSNGAQMVAKAAEKVEKYISSMDNIFEVPFSNLNDLIQSNTCELILEDIDQCYQEALLSISQRSISKENIQVVYTPLHGTGLVTMLEALKNNGVKCLEIVKEQAVEDGDFPTVRLPNPEEIESFNLAIKLATEKDADIVLATDPDADRLGVSIRCDKAVYKNLTGNQIGALITNYILEHKVNSGTLVGNELLIKTIVTSDLGEKIANDYGIKAINTLTGFKYIADQIEKIEKDTTSSYLFGYEESYGYLIGTFVRDKDAIQVAILLTEMVAYYKEKNMSLVDVLNNLYKKFGYHQEKIISKEFYGKDGAEQMNQLLMDYRNNFPKEIGGLKVIIVEDYLYSKRYVNQENILEIDLPKSNVLKFILEDGSWLAIRPSGTEPKCKFYISVIDIESNARAISKLQRIEQDIKIEFVSI